MAALPLASVRRREPGPALPVPVCRSREGRGAGVECSLKPPPTGPRHWDKPPFSWSPCAVLPHLLLSRSGEPLFSLRRNAVDPYARRAVDRKCRIGARGRLELLSGATSWFRCDLTLKNPRAAISTHPIATRKRVSRTRRVARKAITPASLPPVQPGRIRASLSSN